MKGSSRTVSFSFITNVMYRCWDCGNDCVLLNVYLKAASHLLRVGGLKKLFCSDILSLYIGNQNTFIVIKIIYLLRAHFLEIIAKRYVSKYNFTNTLEAKGR